jgi:hypothetical protein
MRQVMSKQDIEQKGSTTFWKPISLDDLIEQQHVSPVNDLDEISDLWPIDDDPDSLLQYVLQERSERRKLSDIKG